MIIADIMATVGGSKEPSIELLSTLIFYFLILLVVLVFGTYAIVVAGRRWRESIIKPKRKPTETSDVWAMHVVPELEADDTDPLGADDSSTDAWGDSADEQDHGDDDD